MAPYSIACSTCGARLKVRDAKAIGELSLCPKCGSMVMITPPTPGGSGVNLTGQRGTSDSSQQLVVGRPKNFGSDFEDAAALLADTVDDLPPKSNGAGRSGIGTSGAGTSGTGNSGTGVSPVKTPPPSPSTIAKKKTAASPAGSATGETPVPQPVTPTPPPIAPPTESMSSIELDPLAARGETSSPLAHAGAPPPPASDHPRGPAAAASPPPASLAGMPPPVIDDRPWASPTQQLLRRYSLIGGAVVAAVVVVGTLLALVYSGFTGPGTAAATSTNPSATADVTPIPDQPIADDATAAPVGENPPATEEDDDSSADGLPADDLAVDNPKDETADETPPENPDDEPADGDAPPIFADGSAEPPADPDADSPPGDAVSDLGEFAPLIDAFPVPELPERAPADGDPEAAPAEEPAAAARRERPEPLAVDVAARLADPVDGIDTGGAPLVKFLELMSQLSTIPITLPPESLAQVQATATSPVSLVLRDTNVEKILQAGLAEHQLKFEVRGEQIVIVPSPKRAEGLLSVSHPVEDLAADAAALDALAQQLTTFVAPQSWNTAGGEGVIDTSKEKLEIRATQAVQFDVHVFCQKLRVARGLAPRSKLDRALFDLPSRSQQSAAKLAVPVRAIFHSERPLSRILNHLEQAAGVTLLVDWESLIAEGWPPHSTTAIVVDEQPLSTALDELLGPMDLAYRAIDENTVQITSRAALETRPELEFYSIAAQIDGDAADKIIDQLQTKLGEELFAGEGDVGAIVFDEPSKCLIVRLPQAQQRMIEAELDPEP